MGTFGIFRSRKMLVLFLLGFSSGLPLLLSGQILQAWLTDEHVDRARIAQFSWVGLFYTLKFLWAPVFDRFSLPFLGRRRGWIAMFQLLLMATVVTLGNIDPTRNLGTLAYFTLVLTFFAASQDIVLDAYMTDALAPDERAAGSSINIIGYRIASLSSSMAAFWLSDFVPYRVIWIVMASFMVVGVAGTLLAEEPAARPPRTFGDAIVLPFVDFWKRYRTGVVVIFLFAMTYRFGDYFSQSLLINFLKGEAKFTGEEIALVLKFVATAPLVIGGIAGAALVKKYGLRRMLLVFGALSAVTHLLYVQLALSGHDIQMFCITVAVDYGATAMAVSAFVAYFMTVCSPTVSATQFAILTSLTSVGQRVFGPLADDVVAAVGWPGFFLTCAALVIPGLVLVLPATKIAGVK